MNSPSTKFKKYNESPWQTPRWPVKPAGPGPMQPMQPIDPGPGGMPGGPTQVPTPQVASPFNPMGSFMGQQGQEAPSQIPGINSQGAGSPMPNAPTPQGPQGGGFGNYGPFAQNASIPWLQRGRTGGTPNMWS